jgi:ABC-type dipeptide/oligopeptide/nickel transport system ATPase component
MEYAPADALFDNPHHLYTHLLLSAIPDSEHQIRLQQINSKKVWKICCRLHPAAALRIAARRKKSTAPKRTCPSSK